MALRVMLFGQSGAGKSALGNNLLGLNNESVEHFIEHNDPNDRKAYGSQYLHGLAEGLDLHVIDTPGLFKGNVDTLEKSWRDVVHAFDISENKVDTFLLVLNSKDAKASERVVQAFLDFFGTEGRVRSVVVFTHNDVPFRANSERIVKNFHFEYLRNHLKDGFPYYFWKKDEKVTKQRGEIVQLMADTAECNQYTKNLFADAQFQFTKKFISELRRKNRYLRISRDEFSQLGIPDFLTEIYFDDSQILELVQMPELRYGHNFFTQN